MEKVDIHNLIDKSLAITNHHFEMNDISTVTKLEAKDPNLIGNANQIVQVLIALFMNAVEAMPRGGALTVATQDILDPDGLKALASQITAGVFPMKSGRAYSNRSSRPSRTDIASVLVCPSFTASC